MGPYNTFEINQMFKERKLSKSTRLKTKTDENYQLLGRYVKRYYKQFVEKNLNINNRKVKLSDKISLFKKGEAKSKVDKNWEFFISKNRDTRVFSMNTNASLIFLDDNLSN